MNATLSATTKLGSRRIVHILNPASGKPGYFDSARRAIEKEGGEIQVSQYCGGITELVCDLFKSDPFAHAVIYGGDGSVNEAVNGIMLSGAADTASFSVYPMGSGNDFSAYVNDSGDFPKADLTRIDIIKTTCNGVVRYCANMANVGFDCDVVWETYTLKKNPLFRGKMSYIAGVAKVLAVKKTIPASITLEGSVDIATGNPTDDFSVEKRVLLTACANSKFYGGGFKAAPIASVSDGLMDVLIVNDVSRLKFISVVGNYRKGDFIDEQGKLG
ncbi:MAG: hypothetical protein IKV39_00600, partial [Clostridia bacterium]|nr:hypothetical protein [Clostridia bacterium]